MESILHSGEVFYFLLVTEETILSEGDIVFCEVDNELLLHKITAINADNIQIGNNKGKINGWTTRKHIFGRYVKTVELQEDDSSAKKFGQASVGNQEKDS